MRVAARHCCGPKVGFRRCRTLIDLLSPGADLRRSTRPTKWPLIDDPTSSAFRNALSASNKTSQSEHPAATKAGHGGDRQKGGEGAMRFTVRALAILASLLTVPAAAAGVDSASLGREASAFARGPNASSERHGDDLGREYRAIVRLACRSCLQRQHEFYRKADARSFRRTAPLRLVKQAAVNG